MQHRNIDCNIKNVRKATPLDVTLSQNSTGCIDALLCIHERDTAHRDFFRKNILHACVNNVVCLEHLLSTKLFCVNELDFLGQTPLFAAARKFHLAAFYTLANEENVLLTRQYNSCTNVLHVATDASSEDVMTAIITLSDASEYAEQTRPLCAALSCTHAVHRKNNVSASERCRSAGESGERRRTNTAACGRAA